MEKNNKLIAEFMGLDKEYKMRGVVDYYCPYNVSWDWLMPVVRKCRLESRCEYDEDDNWNKISWALEECELLKVYEAVVEFIKDQGML